MYVTMSSNNCRSTAGSGALSRGLSVPSFVVRPRLRDHVRNIANEFCDTVNMRAARIEEKWREFRRMDLDQEHEMYKGTKHRLMLFWEGHI